MVSPNPHDERPVAFRLGERIPVRHRVLAAPMCGTSKPPYRRLCRRWGADVVYTEMVKAHLLVRGDPKTLELLATAPDEAPVGSQICGAEPDVMAEAAVRLEAMAFALVDINMGCPVKKVVRTGAGAALLKDPGRVEAVTRACVEAVDVPVTVKIRSGWDHQGHADVAELARAVEAGGAALVTIHARSRAQRHEGAVDAAALARAKGAVAIPVVANGGVVSGEGARQLLRETGCDAVMIGRGAHGRPWLFRDAARAIAGEGPLEPPDRSTRFAIASEHLEGMVALMGLHGVLVYRKYAGWYMADAPDLMRRAYRTRDPEAMRAILSEWAARAEPVGSEGTRLVG